MFGEVVGMVTREGKGGAVVPPIAGSGLVIRKGGGRRLERGERGGPGAAKALVAPSDSAAMSSSDEVYGEIFFGTVLPLLGPLPLSWVPSKGGSWREGNRCGIIVPGMEDTPEAPGSSGGPNALRAWWATAPPFTGGREILLSTRAGVSPGVRMRGGRPYMWGWCVGRWMVDVCVCVGGERGGEESGGKSYETFVRQQ